MFRESTRVIRPKVQPDPQHAAELERKFSELSYTPEHGFHRDRQQPKRGKQP